MLTSSHQNDIVMRGCLLKVERKVFKHAGTPRRVKSQAFSVKSSVTPKTPKVGAPAKTPEASNGGQASGKKDAPAPAQQDYLYPSPGQPFFPAAVPTNGQPLVGASGLPITPSSMQIPLNPYSYLGGYWPGMTSYQDPVTGLTYYSYTPPAFGTGAAVETPTRGRSHERERRYFDNGA